MRTLLLATRNAKKLGELRRMAGEQIQVIGLDDIATFAELPETGATFEENAQVKAVQAAAETGLWSLADDSGLAVDALNGMPGVLSARWSGRHGADLENYRLLLAQLTDVPDERRGGAFVCALALTGPDGSTLLTRGEWRGRILREPRGDNGFGYDPVFEPDDTPGRSSAELDPAEKDRRSHRGLALQAMLPTLQQVLAGEG